MNSKTVIIFGVFDGIHEGHRAFIKEAKSHGDRLVAIVARDSEVNLLKGKYPLHTEVERITALLEVPDIDLVYLGDLEQGTYKILKEVNPDLIFLGYDQTSLSENIRSAMKEGSIQEREIKFGQAFEPETYKSSILNTRTENGNSQ